MKLNYIILALGIALTFSSCEEKKENEKAANKVAENQIDNSVQEEPALLNQQTDVVETESATEIDNQVEGKVIKLTTAKFVEEIYDYNANPRQWVYKGDKPAIIDFYADWCGPCKRVAPIMDDLAKEYAGEINIYKIDTDVEKELAGRVFGIRSIPSILFIPADGQPIMEVGAYPKEAYVNKIKQYLIK